MINDRKFKGCYLKKLRWQILMHTADPRFRGRVMGVRMLGIYGLPLGLLAAGTLIGRIGFAATATLYAATGLVLTILIAVRWRDDVWPD